MESRTAPEHVGALRDAMKEREELRTRAINNSEGPFSSFGRLLSQVNSDMNSTKNVHYFVCILRQHIGLRRRDVGNLTSSEKSVSS